MQCSALYRACQLRNFRSISEQSCNTHSEAAMRQIHDVALIGAGRMGQIHGPNAAHHPELKLRYIVETDRELGAALASALSAEIVTLDVALADPAIKGVIVASSTDMHLEHSLTCINAG